VQPRHGLFDNAIRSAAGNGADGCRSSRDAPRWTVEDPDRPLGEPPRGRALVVLQLGGTVCSHRRAHRIAAAYGQPPDRC